MSIFDWIVNGDIEKVRTFVEKQEDINLRNKAGVPILAIAASHNQLEIVDLLLKHGADVNAEIPDRKENVFLYASYSANTSILQSLYVTRADIKFKNGEGKTAAIIAAEGGNKDAVIWLLTTFPEHFMDDKKRLLFIASARGYLDIVRIIINSKIDINMTDEIGKTAIAFASTSNHVPVIRFLLEHNADLNMLDKYSSNLVGLWSNKKDQTLKTLKTNAPFYYEDFTPIYYHPELINLHNESDISKATEIANQYAIHGKHLIAAQKIIIQIRMIEKTTYGDPRLKENKITALDELVNKLIDKNNIAKTTAEIINDWKISSATDQTMTNGILIATHRRNPADSFFGFFIKHYNKNNATKTAQLLDSLIEDVSNIYKP